jgi:hypothetical protein
MSCGSGDHTAWSAGIQPTGQAVRVMYSVVYDLRGDQISARHNCFPMNLLIGAYPLSQPDCPAWECSVLGAEPNEPRPQRRFRGLRRGGRAWARWGCGSPAGMRPHGAQR